MSPFERGIKGVKGPGLALGFNTFYFKGTENTKTLKHLCFSVLRPKAVCFRALVFICRKKFI